MSHIFISYSKQDIDFARHLRKLLQFEGFIVWMDETRLAPSEKWWPTIEASIYSCAAFVVIMSPEARESDWVEREILLAERMRKPIFPVLLGGEPWSRLANIQYEKPIAGRELSLSPQFIEALSQAGVPRDLMPAVVLSHLQPEQRHRGLPRVIMFGVLVVFLVAVGVFTASKLSVIRLPGQTPVLPDHATTPVVSNNAWTPMGQDFDGTTMVLVPVGCFDMGSDQGYGEERPVNRQCFDAPYWIDKYEVTNVQYQRCVDAGTCDPPHDRRFYDDRTQTNHPVVYVDWFQASAYCRQRNARLPTEREWEYAARGPDNLVYPWGNTFTPDKALVSGQGADRAAAVGSYAEGVSWVGAFDMSGNVWEWVNNLFWPYPYDVSDGRENSGDAENDHTIRGGGFGSNDFDSRSTSRAGKPVDYNTGGDGFRCARSF